MKTYLLLRNNRQSGPFTLAEILAEGLRPQDLVWVEGRSASWRYPSELDELKAYVPAPVLEAPLDLGFSEVQKRVVQERIDSSAPKVMTTAADLPRIDTEPYEMTTFIAQPSFHGRTATMAGSERTVPAFEALAGLLPEDDLMPTMAWQAASDPIPSGRKVSILGVPAEAFPQAKTVQQPSTGGVPKIKVLLPAAMADKTMVVIRRRDLAGQPIQETRARSRRPVLEFIPEDTDAVTPGVTLSAAAAMITESPAALPTVETVAPVPEAGIDELPVVPSAQLVTGNAVALPAEDAVVEAETAINDRGLETGGFIFQLPVNEDQQGSAYWEEVTPESWPKAQVAPTLQVNISLLQKIAVVTAIVSLLAVAILIANSILNPNAYQFGAKPAAKTSVQVSIPTAHIAARP